MVKQETHENTKDSCKVQNLFPRKNYRPQIYYVWRSKKAKITTNVSRKPFKV